MQIYKYRDLTILDIYKDKILTIACDSCGGIGESELDVVNINNEIVGYLTARVCLFETICFNSIPLIIVNNLAVEMENRGKKIVKGINLAIEEYNSENFNSKILNESLTGSTEENIKTLQTAMGLTIIGEKERSNKKQVFKRGQKVISVGLPKVGSEVEDEITKNKGEIISFRSLSILVNKIKPLDILPVGSKGINYEITEFERTNNINIKLYDKLEIDIIKSSGPATTVIAIVEEEDLVTLRKLINEPINMLGEVV